MKADDLNHYLVQLSGGKELDIRPSFGNVHNTRLDASVGSVVQLEGEYNEKDGRKTITKINRIKRL